MNSHLINSVLVNGDTFSCGTCISQFHYNRAAKRRRGN